MAKNDDDFDDVQQDYDEFEDDDDEEGGLSGFVVLLMGIVMLGAFASVVWIAYNQGQKKRANETPYVAADPEPVKIENAASGEADPSRQVYDSLTNGEPQDVEVLAAGPEEPVARDGDDPIGAIAAMVGEASDGAADVVEDAVADRIAEIDAADAALTAPAKTGVADAAAPATAAVADAAALAARAVEPKPKPQAPTPARADPAGVITIPDPALSARESATSTPASTPTPTGASGSALGGSHLVQVGAFRSEAEANGVFEGMQRKFGAYLDGKAKDIERADLGAKGVYYRLRIGPFETSAAAGGYCNGLKERGQDCIVKAR